jgi:predicted DNA-binding protein
MKNDYIQIRMNDEEKAELNALASEKDISVSQFVREAVREKIATLKEATQQSEPATAGAN